MIIIDQCSWDNPNTDPYQPPQGNIAAAVYNYKDLDAETQRLLYEKIRDRKFDDVVQITNGSIQGKYEYVALRDMHSGHNKLCKNVSYTWAETRSELALVYHVNGQTLIVPEVCKNVARVTRVYNLQPPTLPQAVLSTQTPFFLEPTTSPPVLPSTLELPSLSTLPATRTFSYAQPVPLIQFPSQPIYVFVPIVPDIPTWIAWILGLWVVGWKVKRNHAR